MSNNGGSLARSFCYVPVRVKVTFWRGRCGAEAGGRYRQGVKVTLDERRRAGVVTTGRK